MFKNTNQLIAKTYNVNQKKFKNTKDFAQQQQIIKLQKKRCEISDDVPNDVIKLKKIQSGNNLLDKVRQKTLKVVFMVKNMNQIKIYISNNKQARTRLVIEKGQFMVPNNPDYQSLISQQHYEWQPPNGQSVKNINSYCFNKELQSPENLQYRIGEVVSGYYQQGMDQSEVWKITDQMKQAASEFLKNKQQLVRNNLNSSVLYSQKHYQFQIPCGQSNIVINTHCFNKKLQSPVDQEYKIGEVVQGYLDDDPSSKVWQITINKQAVASDFKKGTHAIALNKQQVKQLLMTYMKQVEQQW